MLIDLYSVNGFLKVIVLTLAIATGHHVVAQDTNVRTKQFSKVRTSADQRPVYPSGEEQWANYVRANLKYPEVALQNKVWGMVYVAAVVGADGLLYNLAIERGLGSGCDEEALRLVAACQQPWTPAMLKGEPVDFRVFVPVRFQYPNNAEAASFPPGYDTGGDSTIHTVVPKMAEYPGGIPAMYDLVNKSIRYPKDALNEGVEGKVYVSFLIDKNGNFLSPKIDKGIHPSVDDEALRVVSILGEKKWTPGRSGGVPVHYQYIMPVKFAIR